jgi:hypothetical protein
METKKERPAWMSDELVKDIPERKLEFLEELFRSAQGKSQRELMTLLIPALKKARQESLNFTPEEMNAAVAAIKKYSSAEELAQMEKIMAGKMRQ